MSTWTAFAYLFPMRKKGGIIGSGRQQNQEGNDHDRDYFRRKGKRKDKGID